MSSSSSTATTAVGPHAHLIATLLSDVRRFSQQVASESGNNNNDDLSLERRHLGTKITNTFRDWSRRCANIPVLRESGCLSSSSSCCAVCEEVRTVGDACMTLLNMRLLLMRRQRTGDDDNDNNTTTAVSGFPVEDEDEDVAAKDHGDNKETPTSATVDATVRLVLDCAEIFFCEEGAGGHSAVALLDIAATTTTTASASAAFRAASPWRRLVVSLCERKKEPLELSLKGFKFLLSWVASWHKQQQQQQHTVISSNMSNAETVLLLLDSLGFTNQRSDNSAAVSSAAETVRGCHHNDATKSPTVHPAETIAGSSAIFPAAAAAAAPSSSSSLLLDRVTARALRCSGVMQETYSNASSRRFCQATHFDSILSAILLRHVSASNKGGSIDVLTYATLFTSVGHAVNCCGPASLSHVVASEMGKFLALPASFTSAININKQSDGAASVAAAAASSSVSALDAQILRPFAHHAVVDIFQRGTVADEEQQQKEKERRHKQQLKQQQQQQARRQDTTAASTTSSSSSSSPSTAPADQNDQNPWAVPPEAFNGFSSSFAPLLEPLLEHVSPSVLAGSDRQDVDQWLRSVTALFSSALGVHAADSFLVELKKKKSSSVVWQIADVASTVAAITRAMLRASSSNVTARLGGLNAIQSCAVPLQSIMNRSRHHNSESGKKSNNNNNNNNFSLISFIGSILASMLHGTKIPDANPSLAPEQQREESVVGFFAKTIFPMGRGVGNTVHEAVLEAFWSTIEQIILAPPIAEIQSKMNQQEEDNAVISTESFINDFVSVAVAPMCPSLVSMLCTTSMKELGLPLYQRRRPLAAALLRYESLCRKWIEKEQKQEVEGDEEVEPPMMVCGCSAVMWEKLRESMLIDGGGEN